MSTGDLIDGMSLVLVGVATLAFGFGVFSGRLAPDPAKHRLLKRMRVLGALVAVCGLGVLLSGAIKPKPSLAEEVAAGMRQKLSLPMNVDESTRLDAVDAEGTRLIYRITITKPPESEADRVALVAAKHAQLVGQSCAADSQQQKLLRQGIDLEFVYTMSGRPYPAIVLTAAGCSPP